MNAASWLEGVPSGDRARTLLLRVGPRIATWALAIALGVQAALIVTDLFGAGRTALAPSARRGPATRRFLDLAAITNAHLFGAAPAPKDEGTNAPQTSMPLVLSGIIAGNDPQNGLAILGPTAQNSKVYAVGDGVPGGAKVHAVYRDRVLIERDGRLESLSLPRQLSSSAPPPTTAALQGEAAIERMRRAITEQPGLLAEVLRPQPVMEHNHMNGFRVYPGRNRPAFLRLGLRPGDQVTAINGTPLDDRDRGEQILRTLASSSEARVTVIRGGQQMELTLNLAQLAQEADTLASSSAQSGAPSPPPPQPQPPAQFQPPAPLQPPPASVPFPVPPATDQPLIPSPMPPPAEDSGAGESRQ